MSGTLLLSTRGNGLGTFFCSGSGASLAFFFLRNPSEGMESVSLRFAGIQDWFPEDANLTRVDAPVERSRVVEGEDSMVFWARSVRGKSEAGG